MKSIIKEFIKRGLVAAGFGPIVLAIFYLLIQKNTNISTISINEVCLGIISLSFLAFIAGGMNVLYQIEQIPLMSSIFIHGFVLYCSYLTTYILNDWLETSLKPILYFSIIFILLYVVIWIIIYTLTKKRTDQLNKLLKHHQTRQKDMD